MKKMMAVLLCLCMAVSLAAPAFATEGTDAALLADVLAAVEIAEEADVLLTEEKTDDNIPNTEDDPDKNNTGSGDEGGDETTKTPEDSTDEGGDEGGSGTENPDGSNDGDSGVGYTPLAEGNVTEAITWDISKDYVLTIAGAGEMPDYDAIGKTPWADYFEKITAIHFFGEITRIGANNFAYCSAVTEVKLPETLVSIGDSAFRGMEKLEAIAFPASLKTVEKFAFAHNNLKTIDLPDGIETLGDSAFNPSAAITEITLPGSLTTMGEGVFAVCNALKTITVGEGIKALGTCFINCYGVTTLNLPASIRSLDHNFIAGLGDTAALETITVAKDTLYGFTFVGWKDEDGHMFTSEELITGNPESIMPNGDLSAVWTDGTSGIVYNSDIRFRMNMETGVLTISGTGAMPDFASIDAIPWQLYAAHVKKVVISEGVTSVGAYSFSGMLKLTEVSLPEGITSIGNSAFYHCSALTELTIPSTIETLGSKCLSFCHELESITVPDGEGINISFYMWKDEAGNCYTNSDLLIDVEYEGSLTALWQTGGKLTDTIEWHLDTEGYLTISGTGAMPDYATAVEGSIAPWSELRYDFAVKYVVIMDGITAVGDYNFYYCPKMESLALPNTIQSLGKECLNLKALEAIEAEPDAQGSAFWGFKNEDGEEISVAELLSATGYAGNLTPLWYGFADVATTDWFYDYVMYCYDEGIMNGVGEGEFDPYGGATRAQVVTVLYRLAGEPTGSADADFSDIPAGQWFTEAVNWAAANGIAKGYEDGTFNPYGYVTREEFLVFLNRFTVNSIWGKQLNKWSELYDLSEWGVSDADSISDWALEAETWSYIIGLQTGYDNGDETYSLNPRSYITRAELATFQSRYASNLVLYTYAESSQFMVGYPPSVAVNAFKTEPDEKLEVEEDLEAWCFYDKGVALLVDYSESSKGKIVDWAYTDML